MKRLGLLVVLTAALSVPYTQAGDRPDYQPGKLADFRRESTGSGLKVCSVWLWISGDLTYVLRREAYWRWTYEPTDLIVGDTF